MELTPRYRHVTAPETVSCDRCSRISQSLLKPLPKRAMASLLSALGTQGSAARERHAALWYARGESRTRTGLPPVDFETYPPLEHQRPLRTIANHFSRFSALSPIRPARCFTAFWCGHGKRTAKWLGRVWLPSDVTGRCAWVSLGHSRWEQPRGVEYEDQLRGDVDEGSEQWI